MLKNRLKNLNTQKSIGKSIEIINQNELSQIKGGKKGCECPKLTSCNINGDCDCPNLVSCGTNG
jgi:hypothetical protein